MPIDLDALSKDELAKLKSDVEKAMGSLESRRRADALKAARDAAKEHGFTLEELMGPAPAKSKSAPKYANPANPSQTWTGRGRKPKWVISALEAGQSIDDLAI